jgi:hypothetical protein
VKLLIDSSMWSPVVGDDLLAGAIVTVEEDRIRVRPPD